MKFEELLEAAVDLDKIPDEYLICASYDSGLQVCPHGNYVSSLLDGYLICASYDSGLQVCPCGDCVLYLDKIHEEYLICASHDSGLQVCFYGDCVRSVASVPHMTQGFIFVSMLIVY